MQAEPHVHFEGYRLDLRNECVWRGTQAIHLTTKAFTVLRILIERAGQLVTKAELFAAVWPDTAVSDAALTICIGEIRKALGDTAQAPRFVATVHRRGYRFLAPVVLQPLSEPAGQPTAPLASPLVGSATPHAWPLVGYETELARLHGCFAAAQRGARQLVFVTGEAGIGKTTVVDAFLASLATQAPCWVAWGQCLAQYGAGEAYLPVLDALGRLGRGPAAAQVLEWLRQSAPTWLLQLPALCSPAEFEALQRTVRGGTPARMLRELAEALDLLTVAQPLVLVLEDLHWSDQATLDLLTWLARRREPVRLLVLSTYRPVDVIVHGHPLKAMVQDLAVHRQCVEVRLVGLSEPAIAAYLAQRLPGCAHLPELTRVLYQRTDGHPLFMVQAVDTWLQHGWVAETAGQWAVQGDLHTVATAVPESVRQLIEQEFDALSLEGQRLLEAASVVGESFLVPAVAAGVELPGEQVEAQCAALARQGQFLRVQGVEAWPDGTVAGRYAFRHALHQQVVYERLPVMQQQHLHRRIAARLERAYGDQTSTIAGELAMHCARGGETRRAVAYLHQAAEKALRQCAYREAHAHLTRALALLATVPETPERVAQELTLQLTLGAMLVATQGDAAPEVGRVYTRAHMLCQRGRETTWLFPVLWGLSRFHRTRGTLQTAQELAAQALTLAHQQHASELEAYAHIAVGMSLFHQGALATARAHLTQGSQHVPGSPPPASAYFTEWDRRVSGLAFLSLALWLLGYPDQARHWNAIAVTEAQALAHPSSLAFAQIIAAMLQQMLRDKPATHRHVAAVQTLATEYGLSQRLALGQALAGWAQDDRGREATRCAQIQQGLDAYHTTGAAVNRSYMLALLAEAYADAGQPGPGLQVVDEALILVETMGGYFFSAELVRLRGVLLQETVDGGGQAMWRPAAAWHQALAIARRQQAKALELRAALSLSRLWQHQGQRAAAYDLLAPVYGWFTEGFDTADLQDARALLEALGG
jgi:predicted ATPase/DNA-binding winged helix-turn-helix (wHTH) protein